MDRQREPAQAAVSPNQFCVSAFLTTPALRLAFRRALSPRSARCAHGVAAARASHARSSFRRIDATHRTAIAWQAEVAHSAPFARYEYDFQQAEAHSRRPRSNYKSCSRPRRRWRKESAVSLGKKGSAVPAPSRACPEPASPPVCGALTIPCNLLLEARLAYINE